MMNLSGLLKNGTELRLWCPSRVEWISERKEAILLNPVFLSKQVSRLTWFTRKDVPRKNDVPTASLSVPVKGNHEAVPSPPGQLEIMDGPENTCKNHSGKKPSGRGAEPFP